jgi:hypothetical protein
MSIRRLLALLAVPAATLALTATPAMYLFAFEGLAPTPNGGAAPVGNGNGVKAFGGTFSLVVNP